MNLKNTVFSGFCFIAYLIYAQSNVPQNQKQ